MARIFRQVRGVLLCVLMSSSGILQLMPAKARRSLRREAPRRDPGAGTPPAFHLHRFGCSAAVLPPGAKVAGTSPPVRLSDGEALLSGGAGPGARPARSKDLWCRSLPRSDGVAGRVSKPIPTRFYGAYANRLRKSYRAEDGEVTVRPVEDDGRRPRSRARLCGNLPGSCHIRGSSSRWPPSFVSGAARR